MLCSGGRETSAMAQSLHSHTAKPKPLTHSLGGKMNLFPNICKEKERKLRFGGGEKGVPITVKQHLQQQAIVEKPSPAMSYDSVMVKHKPTIELPTIGERRALAGVELPTIGVPVPVPVPVPVSATVHQYGQEHRLKGKLKWLFEQDRMFWESNSAKSSLRGSPEVDLSKGSRTMSANNSNDAKLLQAVEEGLKVDMPRRQQPLETISVGSDSSSNKARDPCLSDNYKYNGKVSREESSKPDLHSSLALPSSRVHWAPSNSAKVWPHRNPTSQPSKISAIVECGSKTLPLPTSDIAESRSRVLSPGSCSQVVDTNENTDLKSTLDPGGEEFFSDYEAPNSGNSSEISSDTEHDRGGQGEVDRKVVNGKSVDEDKTWTKVDIVADGGAGAKTKDLQNRAKLLNDQCETLYKEKNLAVTKWKQSCDNMGQAAIMAQTLRTAIETLLEASAGDATGADIKARIEMMESQTQTLKSRMSKLGPKNPEGSTRHAEKKTSSKSSEDRIETMMKTADIPSPASPQVPHDTQHRVEALRARLEKLMLATNTRVTDNRGETQSRARKKALHPDDFTDQKSRWNFEKGELKMKGWFNSLSAELSTEEMPGSPTDGFENNKATHLRSAFNTPSSSKHATPFPSIQGSPLHSVYGRESSCPGSARSTEETKKKVIHKIAEEVRLEAEQWFQVQELIQRVGDDMGSLQEACSTWEQRAIIAEAQVASFHNEGHQRKEKAVALGDEKLADLQKEILRLRETVEDVRKQMGSISIDPNKWFEAATHYGYAFMPMNLQLSSVHTNSTCGCKCNCNSTCSTNSVPDLSHPWRKKRAPGMGITEPSLSINSPGAPLFTVEGEMTHTPSEVRLKPQVPREEWMSKPEEDTKLTSVSGQSSKLVSENSAIKELFPAIGVKLQEKFVRPSLESSGSKGDTQVCTRERTSILHQEVLPWYSNLNASLRRSPLKNVLENIVSSKENKRPI